MVDRHSAAVDWRSPKQCFSGEDQSMLKKAFTSDYAGFLAIVLYVVGGGFWVAGLTTDAGSGTFYAAETFLVIAFLWSLGWIWNHPGFRRSGKVRRRRFSDQIAAEHSDIVSHQYAERRGERRNRKLRSSKRNLRWALVGCTTVLFAVADAQFFRTFDDHLARMGQMRVVVFISDNENNRTRALSAPVMEHADSSKDMMFALEGIPTRDVTARNSDRSTVVNVVVRNTSDLEIENAHILIESNVPIKGAGAQLTSISETGLTADVDDLPAFRRSGAERVFPVEIPVTGMRVRAGLFVTVMADDLHPYAAAAKVIVTKRETDPSSGSRPAAIPLAAKPASKAR